MNNLTEIEAVAKRSKALREAATKCEWEVDSRAKTRVLVSQEPNRGIAATGGYFTTDRDTTTENQANALHIADAHNAKLDEYCLSLIEEVRQLRAEVAQLTESNASLERECTKWLRRIEIMENQSDV